MRKPVIIGWINPAGVDKADYKVQKLSLVFIFPFSHNAETEVVMLLSLIYTDLYSNSLLYICNTFNNKIHLYLNVLV